MEAKASAHELHLGVAAVVAAPEISGCGFPAQVAVNALVIDVKLAGHVFRVFIRNEVARPHHFIPLQTLGQREQCQPGGPCPDAWRNSPTRE